MGDNTDKSRAEAKARGDVRYFTGKPCPKGHVSERYVSGGACVECVYENSYRNMGDAKILRSEKSLKRKLELEDRIKNHPLAHLPRSRKDAIKSGDKFYFKGVSCKHGHVDKRYTLTRDCFHCERGFSGVDLEVSRKSHPLSYLPSNRDDALDEGSTYFFTGSQCLNGHFDKRNTLSSTCVACTNIRSSVWRAENKEIHAEMIKAWNAANPERRRSITHMRRSAISSGDSHSEIAEWVNGQVKKCFWCGVDCNGNYHVDHFHPLSKGGAHKIDNLVIACPTCNMKKGSKDPEKFMNEIIQDD